MKKTYLNTSVSRDRAARAQSAARDAELLRAYEAALHGTDTAARILPPSVPADVAAAVRDMCNHARAMRLYGVAAARAAFMADRQNAGKNPVPDMDAPSINMPFVAVYVDAKELAARMALPLSERRKHAFTFKHCMPFVQNVREVDAYRVYGLARQTADGMKPDGLALHSVMIDVYTADGNADGDAVAAAALHVARRQIKNALDTAGRYTADGRYTVQAYMYADACKAVPERADVQDLVSVAALAIIEATAARVDLPDVYAAAFAAANKQVKGERKTAANTVYMDATAGHDDAPLSGQLVSVKGTMRAIIAGDNAHVSDFDAPPPVTAGKRAALDMIMSQLTPTQKDNIERRAAGYSIRQIAAARGCSFQAVDKSLLTARKAAAALYPDIAAEYTAADMRAEYGAHLTAAAANADKPETVMYDGMMYTPDERLTAAAAFAEVGAIRARVALTNAAARFDREAAAADLMQDAAAARAAYHAAIIRYESIKERAAAAIAAAVRLADTADVYAGLEATAARADEAARRLADKAAKSAAIAAKTSADKRKNAAARAARLATAAKNAAARADEARKAAQDAAAARDAARAARAADIAAANVAGYERAAAARAAREAAKKIMPRMVYAHGALAMADVLYIRDGVQTRKGRAPRVMFTRYDTLETVSAFELAARQIAAYKAARR